MDVPPGFVFFASGERPEADILVRLDETVPTPSGGVGGWEELARPKRKPLTEWNGHTTKRLTLGLLIDGYRFGGPMTSAATGTANAPMDARVENAINRLTVLATAREGDDRPPLVRINGSVPRTDLTWFIEDLQWGDALWNGNVRVRQRATVTLAEFVQGKLLIVQSKPYGKPRLYKVRKGDNLKVIAARLLNDGNRWREIATLNRRAGWRLAKRDIGKNIKVPQR